MRVTTRKGKTFLRLDGEMTVARAADLKNTLVDTLEKSDTVEVDLEDVTKVDLAILQLLCSAHRTADRKGKTISIKDPVPSSYLDARRDAGFMYTKQCRFVASEDCFWMREEKE